MNKCLKITLTIESHAVETLGKNAKDGFLQSVVQKYARKYGLEGMAQPISIDKIKIIICGHKDKVDVFVDIIHKELPAQKVEDIEIEPYLKDKDYRGVFRVLEQ